MLDSLESNRSGHNEESNGDNWWTREEPEENMEGFPHNTELRRKCCASLLS